eukprot:scaffold38427_cov52-Attheya_sp.AAC.8
MWRIAGAAAISRASAARATPARMNGRRFVTKAQKRALNKEQLKGDSATKPVIRKPPAAEPVAESPVVVAPPPPSFLSKPEVTAVPPPPPPTPPPPPITIAAAKVPLKSSRGKNRMLIPAAGATLMGGLGAAYYFELFPLASEEIKDKTVEGDVPKKVEEPEVKKALIPEKVEKSVKEPVEKEAEEPMKVEASEAPIKRKTVSKGGGGNRVTQIVAPPVDEANRPPQVVTPVSHDPKGSRVSMGVVVPEPKAPTVTVDEAAKELQSAMSTAEEEAASLALRSAHRALRANLEEGLLKDLDSLTVSELKIRVVQLVTEMQERTKWEAVRMKEFLSMKEHETSEKYMEILQKQRLAFEDLLARRLREQEDVLVKQSNAAVQAKEDSIQSVVQDAGEAMEIEHKAELESTAERVQREYDAKYHTEYRTKLAQEKAEFGKELEKKVSIIKELSQLLSEMESALQVSKSFESGSQIAHKMSAAALALAEKLETSKGAAVELAALQAVAADDGVIASALSTIPSAVKTGVPILPELQAKFEKVHSICRQAALVPEGRTGLEGQLLGMLFSKLSIPPSPDALPRSAEGGNETGDAEMVLARARKYVQRGDLDRAVEQLDKLSGQAAFTVKDWKQTAMDRIMVNKALKSIKLECALVNQTMSGESSEKA